MTDSRFKEDLSTNAAFVLGATPWFETGAVEGKITSWSAQTFTERCDLADLDTHIYCRHFPCHRYKAAFQGQVPPYQAVAAFTGASLLVHAIEECACTDNRRIADVLDRSKLGTVYGDVSFDENRQGTSPFLIVQHGEDLQLGVVTEKNVAMPTLEKKACIAEKRCRDKWTKRPILGDCQDDGECAEGSGALYVLCSHAT